MRQIKASSLLTGSLTYKRRSADEHPMHLLYHAEHAAALAAIPHYALQAGEQALNNFTYPLAITYFTQALRALPPEQVELRYQAVRGRVQALTVLADRPAGTLIRKIRKSGLNPELATQYIQAHAPVAYQADYRKLWHGFLDEATATLTRDVDDGIQSALALLRRECHVKAS